jgi:hypothetical protein
MKRLIRANTIYNVDTAPDNPTNGWGPIFKMSDADLYTYQYYYIDGQEVGHVETWDDDGDWGISAYVGPDRNSSKYLGRFDSREEAHKAVESAL